MDLYKEIFYIQNLNLNLIEQKGNDKWNFRCPVCGDSAKNKFKKRGWIYIHDNKLWFKCFNCSLALTFKNFLKVVDNDTYEKYVEEEKQDYIEKLKNGEIFNKKTKRVTKSNINLKYVFNLNKKYFKPVRNFPNALKYLRNRNIPNDIVEQLYYCVNPKSPAYNMIIFPLYTKENKLYGFQGRSIVNKKFHTHLTNDDYKIYNFFKLDLDNPTYIFESIIDSLFINNSIAMLGSDIPEHILKKINVPIFCFDNDKTGMIKSLKYIERGFKVFIWPDTVREKDINELIINGKSEQFIKNMIDSNIYAGTEGIIRLKLKNRGKK